LPDGQLATETFWYEPRWEHVRPSVEFAGGPSGFKNKLHEWWRLLHESPMRELLYDALLQYCRSLDSHEADATLLGMWQILEKLTNTDKYDLLISRIVRLFRDPEEARQIANHLRTRRNQTVHAGHNFSEEADVVLYQIERLVSQAIFFYLKSGPQFRDQQELCEFLDLSLDQAKLKRRQRLSSLFIKYQNRP
jgi:hypothetical protein